MKVLLEAHHPAHIHFWKYPIRELQERGHTVLLIGRDRDVMKRLLEVYDWIDAEIPPRPSTKNHFPFREMLSRQWTVAKAIRRFRPNVVASLMGSYCQSARLLGCRNVIFTDTETQDFNHRISHPFAHEIHTPVYFRKNLGRKHRRYSGIHELSFLDGRHFVPEKAILDKYEGLEPRQYVLVRMSAWNTLHDRDRRGIGEHIYRFVDQFSKNWRIIISAEEGKVPPGLEAHAIQFAPEDFHHLLAFSRFVLTEGASTSSEAACLGVPSVFINSTATLGIPAMLEELGLAKHLRDSAKGVTTATSWLSSLNETHFNEFSQQRDRLITSHIDLCSYVVTVLEKNAGESISSDRGTTPRSA